MYIFVYIYKNFVCQFIYIQKQFNISRQQKAKHRQIDVFFGFSTKNAFRYKLRLINRTYCLLFIYLGERMEQPRRAGVQPS